MCWCDVEQQKNIKNNHTLIYIVLICCENEAAMCLHAVRLRRGDCVPQNNTKYIKIHQNTIRIWGLNSVEHR